MGPQAARRASRLGLLGWIKGERVDQNLEILSRSAEKLEQVATTQPVYQLWWVDRRGDRSAARRRARRQRTVKRLLGHADREIKRLYEQGEGRYVEFPADRAAEQPPVLRRACAQLRARASPRCAPRSGLTSCCRSTSHIEQERESLSAPSVRLMQHRGRRDQGGPRSRQGRARHLRAQGRHAGDELAPQLDLLKKIGDTLGVLGLGDLRDKVQGETGDLQAIITQRSAASKSTLLRIAATLIRVEDSLDEQLVGMIMPTRRHLRAGQAAGPEDIEFRQVTEAVLRECIVNMARIKEAVAQSFEKPREAQSATRFRS